MPSWSLYVFEGGKAALDVVRDAAMAPSGHCGSYRDW